MVASPVGAQNLTVVANYGLNGMILQAPVILVGLYITPTNIGVKYFTQANPGKFAAMVLIYISCMDTAYVRENPPPKRALVQVQETLHFRYRTKFLVI